MRTKNYRPSADEKSWHNAVASMGCLVCNVRPVELHHVAGAAAKHNKVHIGQCWVLPLCTRHHAMVTRSRDELARAKYGFEFVGPWDAEKLMFTEVVAQLGIPPGDGEVVDAILDYRR